MKILLKGYSEAICFLILHNMFHKRRGSFYEKCKLVKCGLFGYKLLLYALVVTGFNSQVIVFVEFSCSKTVIITKNIFLMFYFPLLKPTDRIMIL